MIQQGRPVSEEAADLRPKWFNSPVTFHEGNISEIRRHIPEFERRPFALTLSGKEKGRTNDRLDMIARKPFQDDHDFIPVGVVSKEYAFTPSANFWQKCIARMTTSP